MSRKKKKKKKHPIGVKRQTAKNWAASCQDHFLDRKRPTLGKFMNALDPPPFRDLSRESWDARSGPLPLKLCTHPVHYPSPGNPVFEWMGAPFCALCTLLSVSVSLSPLLPSILGLSSLKRACGGAWTAFLKEVAVRSARQPSCVSLCPLQLQAPAPSAVLVSAAFLRLH